MGKRKKREEEQKPWCYYCSRVFADETTLILHQKAKHFKCSVCHKKMTTAPSLAIHCSHVHKSALTKVPNAKPGRDNIELEIFGMAGVPPEAFHDGAEEPAAKLPSTGVSTQAPPPSLPPPRLPSAAGVGLSRPASSVYQPAFGQPPSVGHQGFRSPVFSGPLPGPAYPPPVSLPYYPVQPGFNAAFAPTGLPIRTPLGLPTGQAGPLFPIASSPSVVPVQNGQAPPKTSAPGAAAQPGSGSGDIAAAAGAKLIWLEPFVSMEERRAEHPKYSKVR